MERRVPEGRLFGEGNGYCWMSAYYGIMILGVAGSSGNKGRLAS
jgi:hypothetical protein